MSFFNKILLFSGLLIGSLFMLVQGANALTTCEQACGVPAGGHATEYYEKCCSDGSNCNGVLIYQGPYGYCVEMANRLSGCKDIRGDFCCDNGLLHTMSIHINYWFNSADCSDVGFPNRWCQCEEYKPDFCSGGTGSEFCIERGSGGCCDSPKVCAGGACVASCKDNGLSCSLNSECCSGLCWFLQCMACKPLSSSCGVSSECCPGTTCCNGACRLIDGSAGCTQNSDCCSNVCSGGICQTASSCLSEGQYTCYSNSDCCSGLECSGGGCFYPTSYSVTVSKTGNGLGTVTSNPAGIDCGSDCSESYSYISYINLYAVPFSGFVFAGWAGDGSSCGLAVPCLLEVNSNEQVQAIFNILPAAAGYIRVRTTSATIELRLISVADAITAGKGVIKVRTTSGTFAADLVEKADTNASSVRVKTPSDIKAWRKKF